MKAIEFEEVNVRIAENQEEYETIPAYCNIQEGTAMFCFEIDEEEHEAIKSTGKIFIKILTFNQPLQPIAMSCIKEDLYTPMTEEKEVCGE